MKYFYPLFIITISILCIPLHASGKEEALQDPWSIAYGERKGVMPFAPYDTGSSSDKSSGDADSLFQLALGTEPMSASFTLEAGDIPESLIRNTSSGEVIKYTNFSLRIASGPALAKEFLYEKVDSKGVQRIRLIPSVPLKSIGKKCHPVQSYHKEGMMAQFFLNSVSVYLTATYDSSEETKSFRSLISAKTFYFHPASTDMLRDDFHAVVEDVKLSEDNGLPYFCVGFYDDSSKEITIAPQKNLLTAYTTKF